VTIRYAAAGPEVMDAYASVSIAFRVRSILEVTPGDGGGFDLRETPVATPYTKDYDALAGGTAPGRWAEEFDLDAWGLFVASDDARVVGGAAVAPSEAHLDVPGRPRSAVLWDLRVAPGHRGRGVGSALFDLAARWARDAGAEHLAVETQDTNVRACRFYAARGCELFAVDRTAYAPSPEVEREVMLVWSLALGTAGTPS
jgi:GNAT superfamily N-acetyltransferase